MHWTKEPPQEEGWYWIKLLLKDDTIKIVIKVYKLFDDSNELYFSDGVSVISVEKVDAEWAGPIQEPMEYENEMDKRTSL